MTKRDGEVPERDGSADGFDLLRLRAVRALILWRGFPYALQTPVLAIFVLLTIDAWGVAPPEGIDAKLFAKHNPTTLLIWGVWWPSMIWITVLFGRVWCMVCPLELVSNVTERIARVLGIRQRALRRWLTSGAIAVALYALIQLLVAQFHINRVPGYTALFLLGLLLAAAVSGVLFKDRAFCRAFCPVGQLLAAYARGGMIAVRAGSAEACASCVGKDCVRACNRTRWNARGCPSLLNPPRLDSNRDCLVCGQCIKACQPDNMRLLLRRPFHPSDTREPLASWPATAFVMLVSGFVTWELCAEWPRAERVFLAVPEAVSRHAGIAGLEGAVCWLWALVVVPLGVWTVFAWVVRGPTIVGPWQRMALPLVVVIAAGHMTKGLAKLVTWIGFLPYALARTDGVATIAAMQARSMPSPDRLLSPSSVALVGVALIATALWLSIREARLARAEPIRYRDIVPSALFAVGFIGLVCGLCLQSA